jgi:pectinesterase
MSARGTDMVARHAIAVALALSAGLATAVSGQRAGSSRDARVVVRVENPIALERYDETIVLSWASLRQRLPSLAPGRVRVREIAGNGELVTQALDANSDGAPDSLLFQASFFPGETKSFTIDAAAPSIAAKPRVHVKFVPERTDVAWENDRIAFRTYGQLLWQLENLHSSGVDVWVKRTRDLVLDKWYGAGHDAYHADRGEGADFYKVGPTLGGGATAVWRNGKLYRAENFKTHRIIADGPIRAIFELDFDPWDAGGLRVTETKRIAIDAGQQLYWQQSVFRGEGVDSLQYAVGFVKRPGLVGSMSGAQPWAWLTGWGPVDNKPGEGGHGDLGTAVLLDRGRIVDFKETEDHYIVVATTRSGRPVVHYLGAGWTGSRDFQDVQDWWKYLDEFARRLSAPLRVTLGASTGASP